MVGNAHDAALAFNGTLPVLGEGSTRYAYISEDMSTVYKVERFDVSDEHTANRDEYALSKSLSVPAPYLIPPMTLYPNGVLAMPYYGGTLMGECYCLPDEEHYGCHDEATRAFLYSVSPDCTTWGNTVLMEDGTIVLIDLGH